MRAISEAHLPPQVAIDELWHAAGEGRIKATALEYENAKAFDGNQIEIPAHYWAHLKRADDPLTGKAMLSDDHGRVYREVQFPRLDVKKLWPKSPPLSGEPLEPDAVEVLPEPEPDEASRAGVAKAKPTPDEQTPGSAPSAISQRTYPNGTDGISTSAIHRKLNKDTELEAELKEDRHQGRAFSDARSIACSAAAQSNPAAFWACPACPTMPKLKPLISL